MNETTLHIGASGHQQIGDEVTIRFVSQHIHEILAAYQRQTQESEQNIVVYSSLAIGADQLFVRAALELSIPVEVVIPCAQYEEIFSSVQALDEYHRLLNCCRRIHRLPAQVCSEESFLAAGQWIVDHSDLLLLVWNGYPAIGKGGTGDIANYARLQNRPFIHLHTRLHSIKQYGTLSTDSIAATHVAAKREFAIAKQTVYQGPVLTVNQYKFRMPNGKEIERDIVERPESVLVLPVGQQQTVLMIEEYDLGAEVWQLTLPGGRVTDPSPDGLRKQAERELREEIGYHAGKLEKLLDFYSHPGYVAHKVHLFVARELEWDPLDMDEEEELRVQTFTLDEALEATRMDYRCDPEASLALWLYTMHGRYLP